MTKFLEIFFFGAFLIGCCAAEAPLRQRFGRQQQNRQFAARQQLAPESVTPYPAAGIKPEIPFNLPSEIEAKPKNTYLPPDSTYGPPPPPAAAAPPVDPVSDEVDADVDSVEDAEVGGSTPNEQPAVVVDVAIAPTPAAAAADADQSVEDENNEIIPAFGQRSGRYVVGRRVLFNGVARNGKLQRRRVVSGRLVRL